MSKPKLYLTDVLMMALADLSIVYSKPEWTMSFSEAPFKTQVASSVNQAKRRSRREVKVTYSHALQELGTWLDGDLGANAAKVLLQRVLNAAQQVVVGVLLVLEGQATVADMVQVLEPLEIGDGDTTSVDVQVWNDKHVALLQDLISLGGSWTVGTFSDDL